MTKIRIDPLWRAQLLAGMSPETRAMLKEIGHPATMDLRREVIALAKGTDREAEIAERMDERKIVQKEDALRLRDELRASNVRAINPKPAEQGEAQLETAWRTHRQSREQLMARERQAIEEHSRRVFREMRDEHERKLAQENRLQFALDRAMNEQLAWEAQERRLRKELDPYNLGLYGPMGD